MGIKSLSLIAILFFVPQLTWAGAVITYHGRILNDKNRPVESEFVKFKIQIFSPGSGKCLLFEEERDLSMLGSDGVFSIPIGDHQGMRTANDPGIPMESIFVNNPQVAINTSKYPGLKCHSGSSYVPSVLDQRILRVSFDDLTGAGLQTLPPMDLNFVPFAVSSYSAQRIGEVPAESVLRLTEGAAQALTPQTFDELLRIASGTSTQYEQSGKLLGSSLPVSLAPGQVLGWNSGGWSAMSLPSAPTETDPSVKSFAKIDLPACGTNEFLKGNGAGQFICVGVGGAEGGTVTSVAAGTGLVNVTQPGVAISTAGTLAVDVGTTAGKIVQLDENGRLPAVDGSNITGVQATAVSNTASISTSGSIATSGAVSAGSVTTSGDVVVGGSGSIRTTNGSIASKIFYLYDNTTPVANTIGLRAPSTVSTSYNLSFPDSQGGPGQVLAVQNGAGALEWKTLSIENLQSETGGSFFDTSASCLASQTMTYSAPDDKMVCSNIAIVAGQVSGLGALATASSVDLSSSAATGTLAAARFPAMSGDVTSTAGSLATTIANGAVGTGKIANGAVTSAKIANEAVGTAQLADGSVTADKLSGTIGTTNIADLSITSAKLANTAVTSAKIANGAVGSAQIANGAVGTTQLADASVTAAKLSGALGTANIADLSITTAKLANASVNATKLADGSVTTAKIATNAVTANEIAATTITNTEISNTAAIAWSKISKSGAVPGDVGAAPAAGSTSITTLGSITAGTWNGSTIAVARGGTGTTNGSITGTGALTFTSAANTNVVLNPQGTGVVSVSSSRITNVAEPIATTDVATKAYVDAAVAQGASVSMVSAVTPTLYRFLAAITYCRNLSAPCERTIKDQACSGTVYSDWRLPTQSELLYFSGITGATDVYSWTLTPHPQVDNYGTFHFIVNLQKGSSMPGLALTGSVYSGGTLDARVRCVR